MMSTSSKLRARAASPSSVAAESGDLNRRWSVPVATQRPASPFECDAFRGLPFGAGVFCGQIAGCPLQLLGFLMYVATALPRSIMHVIKVVFFHMIRALLHAIIAFAILVMICNCVAVFLGFNLISSSLGSRFPEVFSHSRYGMDRFAPAAIFLFAALYFIPKLRKLFNVIILLLLAPWLQPVWFERGVALCNMIAIVAWTCVEYTIAVAAENAAVILALLLVVLVMFYLLDFMAWLLNICLWLLLFCPRFVFGILFGVVNSLEYAVCAVTLTYHPDHSW
jgi:hypothetical protein